VGLEWSVSVPLVPIIYGHKIVRTPAGLVADFCPLCRAIKPYEVLCIEKVPHLYHIITLKGEVAGFELRCMQCAFVKSAPEGLFQNLADAYDGDLEQLVEQTFPTIRGSYAERLVLEDQLRHGQTRLAPEVRQSLLEEPFALLAGRVEWRFGAGVDVSKLDRRDWIALRVSMLVAFGLLGVSVMFQLWRPDDFILGALSVVGCAALLAVAAAVVGSTSERRFLRERVRRPLVRALKPLRPTLAEVSAILEKCRGQKLKIAQKLSADDVIDDLAQAELSDDDAQAHSRSASA
jgi:hypothetical protein